MKDVPLYLNWQFWSAATAFVALILSQLPPLKLLLKKGSLTIEKYGTLGISHSIGSPNVNLFVILKNIGGSSIGIHSIDMRIIRKNSAPFLLKGRGYALNPHDYNFTMFTPLEIGPNQTWAHTIGFSEPWDRTKQKEYKGLYANIRDTITDKHRETPLGIGERHEIDDDVYQNLCSFFDGNFQWTEGEYVAEILVKDKEDNIFAKDSVKFTVFESDSVELRTWTEDYKYGHGIHLPVSQKQTIVWVELSD
ncbi:hypothetical protein GCM10007978_19630 [Shewanella hanedai]|uniref:Uncharacterized protein n=1 Tax=Shewanella hanedai TaxID=25 RepID=A0A553JMD3_SHEHA|nr:hypothetical protein [Shewanella hanedai]TRY13581.1 hypothetical protein FN961_15200 [Shewanella hanedai]GGI81932.1 hypothetical protein GCM10007978_19630 [Shewanella hanedai]